MSISPLLFSAPMAGFTNYAFRELLRYLGGVDLIATEMVSARAFIMKETGTTVPCSLPRLWGVETEPRPLCVQIWDNDPDTLAELARKLAFDYKVSCIDLNFGCPAKQIANRSESGSYLLQFPDRIGIIVQKVVNAVKREAGASCPLVEVSAKIRLGKTRDTINAVDVAQAVEDAGAVRLTVHGRTASQMYSGQADWGEIARIKPKLRNIQLIGNGDIRTVDDALFRLRNEPVDGIMIGRAAVAQPWIFRNIRLAMKFVSSSGTSSAADIPLPDLIAKHYELLRRQFDERLAVVLLQKSVCHYATGLPGARQFRNALGNTKDKETFFQSVNNFFRQPPEN